MSCSSMFSLDESVETQLLTQATVNNYKGTFTIPGYTLPSCCDIPGIVVWPVTDVTMNYSCDNLEVYAQEYLEINASFSAAPSTLADGAGEGASAVEGKPVLAFSVSFKGQKLSFDFDVEGWGSMTIPVDVPDVTLTLKQGSSANATIPLVDNPYTMELGCNGYGFIVSCLPSLLLCANPKPPAGWMNLLFDFTVEVTGITTQNFSFTINLQPEDDGAEEATSDAATFLSEASEIISLTAESKANFEAAMNAAYQQSTADQQAAQNKYNEDDCNKYKDNPEEMFDVPPQCQAAFTYQDNQTPATSPDDGDGSNVINEPITPGPSDPSSGMGPVPETGNDMGVPVP